MGTSRMVRFLMLKGADKTIVDKKGRNAMDCAKDVLSEALRNELVRILGPPGKLECLMLSPPTSLTFKNRGTMTIYVCFFIFW